MPCTAIGELPMDPWNDELRAPRICVNLPVTRTRPRTTTGGREILGDEIAGRDDEKGTVLYYCSMITILPVKRECELSLLGDTRACGIVAGTL